MRHSIKSSTFFVCLEPQYRKRNVTLVHQAQDKYWEYLFYPENLANDNTPFSIRTFLLQLVVSRKEYLSEIGFMCKITLNKQ